VRVNLGSFERRHRELVEDLKRQDVRFAELSERLETLKAKR
jgi:hypothetical protein